MPSLPTQTTDWQTYHQTARAAKCSPYILQQITGYKYRRHISITHIILLMSRISVMSQRMVPYNTFTVAVKKKKTAICLTWCILKIPLFLRICTIQKPRRFNLGCIFTTLFSCTPLGKLNKARRAPASIMRVSHGGCGRMPDYVNIY